jgi:threonyl-tRNA synthetase
MAQAVQKIFPSAKIAIGPIIENGFYYDFDIKEHQLVPQDLLKIEKEMKRIIKRGQKIERVNVDNVDEKIEEFKKQGEVYKAELLEEYKDDDPTIYVNTDTNGDVIWEDLCKGPHLLNTSKMKSFKLLNVAGAYWRGDEKNIMLQRIYATAFWTNDELTAYLHRLEEAKKRDHRKLGKELDLFSTLGPYGPGLVIWHPNLATVRDCIETMWKRSHVKRGYSLLFSPHIAKRDLWDTSGHTAYYMDKMFKVNVEEQEYLLRPMNCPFHIMYYQSKLRSYRELPMKLAELGTVYRFEQSGEVHGMTRVRGFTQDDGHVFCTMEQFLDESIEVVDICCKMLTLFGVDYEVELSTRPKEGYAGSVELWDKAEEVLKNALEKYNLEYEVQEGEGAFYGPKIDFKLKDALDRIWQCSTVQLDFNLPKQFGLKYVDKNGEQKEPVLIHRAILGSMERFVGTIIEHYAGAFPVWLAPLQVAILPINERVLGYCQDIKDKLININARVETDIRNETIGSKIRDAQLKKCPYMLIVGDKEVEEKTVALRTLKGGDTGSIDVNAFVDKIKKEVEIPVID